MDAEREQNTLATNHLSPPNPTPNKQTLSPSKAHPAYESDAARSTRMAIDSASYMTTPCDSPPSEYKHVFSAQDFHRKAPDVETLVQADQALERARRQDAERCSRLDSAPAERRAMLGIVGVSEDGLGKGKHGSSEAEKSRPVLL